jgi:hypothetical protein
MRQELLDFFFKAIGHRGNGECRLRFGTHGKNVAETMVGGYFAKEIRIVYQGPKKIYRVHHDFACRHGDDRGVVRMLEPHQHVVALGGLNAFEDAAEDSGPNFGPAASAAHGQSGDILERLFASQTRRNLGRRLLRHVGQVVVLPHKPAINPVFQSPDNTPGHVKRAAGGHGVPIARTDQRQPLFLRRKRPRPLSRQGEA